MQLETTKFLEIYTFYTSKQKQASKQESKSMQLTGQLTNQASSQLAYLSPLLIPMHFPDIIRMHPLRHGIYVYLGNPKRNERISRKQ